MRKNAKVLLEFIKAYSVSFNVEVEKILELVQKQSKNDGNVDLKSLRKVLLEFVESK